MSDDDDIDRGAFLLILGTLAGVIAIVSWWFLDHSQLTAPASAGGSTAQAATVADFVSATPELSTLGTQLDKAGLGGTLAGAGPFTVFAPSNTAFGSMDTALAATLVTNVERLKKVLGYHVVAGRIAADELAARAAPLTTLEGETLTVTPGSPVKLADGKLQVTRSVAVGNGIVYVVDQVAVPPTVVQAVKDEATLNDLFRLDPVRFATGSSAILPESIATLDKAVDVLRKVQGDVEIQGHTDSTGDAASNQTLSEARANAVRDYLVSKGIPAPRLTAKGYGQTRPVADNNTDAGRAQNRRIEFSIA